MNAFVELQLYGRLSAGDLEMNQTHPCQQETSGLVGGQTQEYTTASGLEAVALGS